MININYHQKTGKERRKYRKYAPWIFFGAEAILAFEILYTADFFVGLGNMFLIGFIAVMYFRVNKLIKVLDRNEKMRKFNNKKIF